MESLLIIPLMVMLLTLQVMAMMELDTLLRLLLTVLAIKIVPIILMGKIAT